MEFTPVEGLQAVAHGLERRRSRRANDARHQGLSRSRGIRCARRKSGASSYLGPWNGGTLTTAGNLVVQGDASGNFNVVPGRHRREAVVDAGAERGHGRSR